MSKLQSVTMVPINDKALARLHAVLRPTALGPDSHQYHIGYERAKADVLAVVNQEAGVSPTDAPEVTNDAPTRQKKVDDAYLVQKDARNSRRWGAKWW